MLAVGQVISHDSARLMSWAPVRTALADSLTATHINDKTYNAMEDGGHFNLLVGLRDWRHPSQWCSWQRTHCTESSEWTVGKKTNKLNIQLYLRYVHIAAATPHHDAELGLQGTLPLLN